jgi:hypothetical protein
MELLTKEPIVIIMFVIIVALVSIGMGTKYK